MSTETESGPAGEQRRSGPLVSAARWMEGLSDTAYAYLLLTPIFILLGAIALYPLVRTFEFSLRAQPIAASYGEFVGFDNYIALLQDETVRWHPGTTFLPEISTTSSFPFISVQGAFQSALLVTLIFTFVSVLFETLIGLGQALLLDKDFYGRRWLRVAIIIPWAVPVVVQGIIFYLMFHPSVEFIRPILADIGLIAANNTLNNAQSALTIIIIGDIWKTSAFMALLILAGLQSIDRGLYDVAKVAGASKWQQFKMITFPLILPTIGIAILFRTVQAMRIYGLIDAISSCTVVPSLSCMVVRTFNSQRYAISGTYAFVTAALIGVIVSVIIYQQYKSGGI